ncbi:MAG: hypothetical protein ABFC57_14100 [Veillonellales bacterium]
MALKNRYFAGRLFYGQSAFFFGCFAVESAGFCCCQTIRWLVWLFIRRDEKQDFYPGMKKSKSLAERGKTDRCE